MLLQRKTLGFEQPLGWEHIGHGGLLAPRACLPNHAWLHCDLNITSTYITHASNRRVHVKESSYITRGTECMLHCPWIYGPSLTICHISSAYLSSAAIMLGVRVQMGPSLAPCGYRGLCSSSRIHCVNAMDQHLTTCFCILNWSYWTGMKSERIHTPWISFWTGFGAEHIGGTGNDHQQGPRWTWGCSWTRCDNAWQFDMDVWACWVCKSQWIISLSQHSLTCESWDEACEWGIMML